LPRYYSHGIILSEGGGTPPFRTKNKKRRIRSRPGSAPSSVSKQHPAPTPRIEAGSPSIQGSVPIIIGHGRRVPRGAPEHQPVAVVAARGRIIRAQLSRSQTPIPREPEVIDSPEFEFGHHGAVSVSGVRLFPTRQKQQYHGRPDSSIRNPSIFESQERPEVDECRRPVEPQPSKGAIG